MKKINYNSKKFFLLCVFVFVCLQSMLLFVGKYNESSTYLNTPINIQPIGEIAKGINITQELPRIAVINDLDIQFATYSKNITSDIKITIFKNNKEEVFSTIISGKELKDNEYYRLPINLKIETNYMPLYLNIQGVDGISGNSVTVLSSDIHNKENSCYINDKNSNRTLNIKINSNSIINSNILTKMSTVLTAIFLGIILVLGLDSFEKVNKLKKIYTYRYWIIAVIFISSVFILKINFSSFEGYKGVLYNNINSVEGMQIGTYREIRSDEWGVLTPLQLSQEGNDYREKSELLGENTEVSVISGGIPTKDISIIGKPFLWGFVLFGSEIGFSWYSVSKMLLLLIFSYKLIYILTSNKKHSVIGSVIISFSPGIQWWFTTNSQCTEAIICWEMIIVSIYNIFGNLKNKYINAAVLFVAMIGFTLVLYPPLQIPLFYLGIALLIGLYLENKDSLALTKNNLLILGGITVGYLFVMFITLSNMLPEIQKILNTVYPGKRLVAGGTLSLDYLFNYIPTLFLPFKNVQYSNASEISSFITLFPIPLIVYFIERKKYSSNIIKSLIVFIIGSLIFMYVGFPNILTKVTLMNLVPEKRLYVIFGLACTIFIICMSSYEERCKENATFPIGQVFIYIVAGYYIYRNYPNLVAYLGKLAFIICLLLISTLIYIFNRNRSIFMKVLLLLTFISGVTINPINFGIEEMRKTQFSLDIMDINKKDPGIWITVNDLWISKYILAQGIPVLNALNYPPMLKTWGSLDKDNQFTDIYNRYAHVVINLDENSQTEFNLRQPDVFQLNMSAEEAAKVGIKYVVAKQAINQDNIRLIHVDHQDNIFIYKVTEDNKR